MSGRPNFYELLNLDPAVDDWPTIEGQLKTMQRKWAKDRSMGNPKDRRHAEGSLARLKEIETVLSNPDTRREEARERLRQVQQEEKQKRKQLDESVDLLRTGGAVTDDQIRKLVQTFAGTFSEDDIRKHLKNAKIPFASDPAAGRKPRAVKEQIDTVTGSTIRMNLNHLGLKTLYEFLQMGHRSSPKALADKAEEILKENHRLGKTDADSSAQNALAGFCKTVFQNDQEKARYDNFFVVEAMDSLKDNLELAGADNFLTRDELDTLVKQARERGVPADDALAYIENRAAERKWNIQKSHDALPAQDLRQCGFCSTLATPSATRCSKCGEVLDLECPGCSTKNPSDSTACSKCGYRTGDGPSVYAYLKEGQQYAASGDLTAAIQNFDKCLLYWAGWKPAQEARDRALKARQTREADIHSLETLVNDRKLRAAETELARFERTHGSAGLGSLKTKITDGLAEAARLFNEGERLSRKGENDNALECHEKALLSCVDFQLAIQAMAKSPPPAPLNLRVRSLGNGFRLAWDPPGAVKNLSYRILRKAGGVPKSENDGHIVGDVRTSSLDDPDTPVGTPWHYAVFSVRGSSCSTSTAHSGPHLRMAEVSDLEVMAGNGDVSITWEAPPGAIRIEVWRKEGASPASRDDGQALITSGSSAQDTGLTNGALYGYRVLAVYADPARPSDVLYTPGVTASASPVAPPAPISDLNASRTGKNVLLTWALTGAVVQIRQTDRPPSARPGTILPLSQADRIGTLVPNSTRNSAQVTLTQQGRVFFVPLSVAAGTAVLGTSVEVTTIDAVTNLKTLCSGPNIVLTWDWPPGLTEAAVAWSHDKYPADHNSADAAKTPVTLAQYSQRGCWILPNAERKAHYFSVFAAAPGGLYAPPARIVESMGNVVSVSYEVSMERTVFGKAKSAWVALTCTDKGNTVLPGVVVIGKPGLPPLSSTDGIVLTEWLSVPLTKGAGRIPLGKEHLGSNLLVKLFFKNPDDCRMIRLFPAEASKLRIG